MRLRTLSLYSLRNKRPEVSTDLGLIRFDSVLHIKENPHRCFRNVQQVPTITTVIIEKVFYEHGRPCAQAFVLGGEINTRQPVPLDWRL